MNTVCELMRHRNLVHWLLAVAVFCGTASPAAGQVTSIPESRLVESLAGNQQAAKAATVAHILQQVPPDQRGPALEQALAKELERVNAQTRERTLAIRAGTESLTDDPLADYRAALVKAVSQSSNPMVIPALVGALDTGAAAPTSLARFGERALEGVLAAARDERPVEIFQIIGALNALTLMVEPASTKSPLSARARGEVISVAVTRLTGRQDPIVVSRACSLAIATGDQALRNRVGQIAADRTVLAQMGIVDAESVQLVQRGAQKALAKK